MYNVKSNEELNRTVEDMQEQIQGKLCWQLLQAVKILPGRQVGYFGHKLIVGKN